MDAESKIVVFQERQIRRVWHNEDWWYPVIDVIAVLTDSSIPSRYWNDLKRRVTAESGNSELYAKCVKLKFEAADGKNRPTECADTETLFRIIMSIPSPKAEPFKQWLASVGKQRIQEIENPELAIDRAREYYRAKGYSDKWIDTRIKSIEIRQELTDEWKGRGVREGMEYSILTAEISKATFGLIPSEYKSLKGLKRENLRDHMTNLELIFTMLGEENTVAEAVNRDAQGFDENQISAIKGGKAAGDALHAFEKTSGRQVVSDSNFLGQIAEAKKKKRLKGGDDDK
ncbi:MAG: Bro-N domain-containing protein [Saprospiraceae bacterium]